MRFYWTYINKIRDLDDNSLHKYFKEYLLDEGMERTTLDKIPSNLKRMDKIMESKGERYTEKHAKFLKELSNGVFTRIKKEKLKNLIEDEDIDFRSSLKSDLKLDTIPEDYTVNDVTNQIKTNELIGQKVEEDIEEYLDVDKKITEEQIIDRITKENLKIILPSERKALGEAGKGFDEFEIILDLPAGDPQTKNSKINILESKGIKIQLEEFVKHEKEKQKLVEKKIDLDSASISGEISQEFNMGLSKLLDLAFTTQQEKKSIENKMKKLIVENKEDVFKDFLDNDALRNIWVIYDINLTIIFDFNRTIRKGDRYEKDMRRKVKSWEPNLWLEGEDKPPEWKQTGKMIVNPNYKKPKLDRLGKKIPLFSKEALLDNRVYYKKVKKGKAQAVKRLRPVGKGEISERTSPVQMTRPSKVVGQEEYRGKTFPKYEKIKGKQTKVKTGRTGSEVEEQSVNMARNFYLKHVQARLKELGNAIESIPKGS